jgi:hypothetical protein
MFVLLSEKGWLKMNAKQKKGVYYLVTTILISYLLVSSYINTFTLLDIQKKTYLSEFITHHAFSATPPGLGPFDVLHYQK